MKCPLDGGGYGLFKREASNSELAQAIDAGYWPAVVTADNIARAEHGVQAMGNYRPREAYMFKRLLERGIGDPDYVEAYRSEAERLGLGDDERAAADAEAAERFAKAFGSRPMTEAERYENCGN